MPEIVGVREHHPGLIGSEILPQQEVCNVDQVLELGGFVVLGEDHQGHHVAIRICIGGGAKRKKKEGVVRRRDDWPRLSTHFSNSVVVSSSSCRLLAEMDSIIWGWVHSWWTG